MDGIDAKEARIIAMRTYLKGNEYRNYRVGSAKVYNDNEIQRLNSGRTTFIRNEDLYTDNNKELKFPGSWYVLFRPKFLSLFSRYYLIIVDKNDGSVLLEHDSNVFGDLVEGVVKVFFLPRLVGAMAISIYYKDKKEVPESVEILKKYLMQLPEGKKMKGDELDGLKFEKISPAKLKVFYNSPGLNELKENSGLDKLFNSMYELELVTEGDKTFMKIGGDFNGTIELGEKNMSLSPAGAH
jgi:hypothetical protein